MARSLWKSIRTPAAVVALIGGGFLQYEDTNTRHPSILLRIWGVSYSIIVFLVLVALATCGVAYLRRRTGGRRLIRGSYRIRP